ncbi:hypothetical protein, partial [Kribbella alba]|uniref:hypothetical protein n=1 Tax=Kribbella alba TaxID=190197 RepID=UPI0031D6976A
MTPACTTGRPPLWLVDARLSTPNDLPERVVRRTELSGDGCTPGSPKAGFLVRLQAERRPLGSATHLIAALRPKNRR